MINKYYEIYSPLFSVNKLTVSDIIIIIMCIHHAPVNTLSAHMTHINLNMIFCTHVEHSPSINNPHKAPHGKKNMINK